MHTGRARRAFSLVELLVVTIIITVVASLIVGVYVSVRDRARTTKTRAYLNLMVEAIATYQSDTGSYPPSSGVSAVTDYHDTEIGNRCLCYFLWPADRDRRMLKAYLEGDLVKDGRLLDAWGNPYIYFRSSDYGQPDDYVFSGGPAPGVTACVDDEGDDEGDAFAPTTFQLWSAGPNGVDNRGRNDGTHYDDIVSWETQ